MTTPARTRYAPSPTGDPHVGNIRTALFAWAMARSTGGQFILRVEDTDQKRLVDGSLEAIFESLEWLGLNPDEGPREGGPSAPYVQSQRLEHYQAAAAGLLARGAAYRCFCGPERLDEMRKFQQANKLPPGYDGLCHAIPAAEAQQRAESGEAHVVRFHMPDEGETVLEDVVRGTVRFENRLQDDAVILKSDGFPTYHLAAIVDDHEMGITHVIRGEEWLSSAPKHLQLIAALGWEPPVYAHLPLIMGPDKKKLSKRTGDTALLEYRAKGYLPEAMTNFLALLGWSLDDKTVIIPRDTFVEHFALERIVPNPAVFDLDKLNWLNGQYIRELPAEEWSALVAEWCERGLPESVTRPVDRAVLDAAAPLVQERVAILSEIPDRLAFLFGDAAPAYERELLGAKVGGDAEAARILDTAIAALGAIPEADWLVEQIEAAVRNMQDTLELKLRKFVSVLYVAVMGSPQGIPLFDSMALLGRDRTLARLEQAKMQVAVAAG